MGRSKVDIKLDSAGIGQVLRSPEVGAVVAATAAAVRTAAAALLPPGTDVVVDSYTTDRAAASVTIRDAQGKKWQARDGVLTRAAAAQGLEVRAAPT